jgi:hypothetical protein
MFRLIGQFLNETTQRTSDHEFVTHATEGGNIFHGEFSTIYGASDWAMALEILAPQMFPLFLRELTGLGLFSRS